jgi:hypothetical protein
MKPGSVKRDRKNPRKDPYWNVSVLPVQYKGYLSNRLKILSCKCGGQLFVLCANGNVICHSCRAKEHFKFSKE